MTGQLLPWVLVSLLGAVVFDNGDGRDDPYQWLEEVGGDEAYGLGQGAERREHRRADSVRPVPHARAPAPGDPRLRCPDSGHPEGRPALLQLLAGREEPAGPLASHHAGGVSQGQAQLGARARPGRLVQPGGGELGLARRPGAAARVQGRPGLALARRGRRGRRPRVQPRDEVVRQGRLHAARGQEPRLLARE